MSEEAEVAVKAVPEERLTEIEIQLKALQEGPRVANVL